MKFVARTFRLPLAALLVAAPLTTGCVAEYGPDEDVGLTQDEIDQRQPIINGDLPFAEHHQAVVSLHNRFGTQISRFSFCTGTLISPTVVLTAAHCVENTGAQSLAIYVGDNPRTDSNPEFHGVSEVFSHPNYNPVRTINDLALLRLQSTVTSVTPVPPLPADLGFTNSDNGNLQLEFVGFGRTETGSSDQKLVANAIFAGTGCVVNGCGFGLTTAEARNAMISYSQFNEGPCNGDSGGPAFVVRNGNVYVGGMTSFGDAQCRTFGVSARADTFESLILSFAPDIASGEPEPEPTPEPVPEPQPEPAPSPDSEPDAQPGVNVLENGSAFVLAGPTDSVINFEGTLEDGAQNLLVSIAGNNGDADLYVRFGAEPTATAFDCRPFLGGSNEQCAFANPPAGPFFVQVRGYEAYSDVQLNASWDEASEPVGPGPFFELVEGISGRRNESQVFTFNVPAGDSTVRFVLFGGSGDADLYVKRNGTVTTNNWDCRPFRDGNDEECLFNDPAGGTYSVMVRGYRNFNNVSLQASRE